MAESFKPIEVDALVIELGPKVVDGVNEQRNGLPLGFLTEAGIAEVSTE